MYLRLILSLLVIFLSAHARAEGDGPAHLKRQKLLFPFQGDVQSIRVAFFDADSTLRVSKSGVPWAQSENDFVVLPGVAAKIRQLNQQGYLVAIVSNQGPVPEKLSYEAADAAFFNLATELAKENAFVHVFDYAEHHDQFRKPLPGMYHRLSRVLKEQLGGKSNIDLGNSFMVGDAAYTAKEKRPDGKSGYNFSNFDRLFAEGLGIPFHEAADYFAWKTYGVSHIETVKDVSLIERRRKRTKKCESRLTYL